MRVLVAFVGLVGLLAGVLSTEIELHEGEDLPMLVQTFPDNVIGCYLETPKHGTIQFKPEDLSDDRFELREDSLLTQCQVTVKSVTVNDNGVWRLYSVSDLGVTKDQNFTVTVDGASTPETPSEPTYETITLEKQEYITKLGDDLPVSITLVGYRETDTCQIQTPDGHVYNITSEGTEVESVTILTGNTISCGVIVSIDSEDVVGDWVLIAKESSMGSDGVERRLPFTINVEEAVNSVPSGIVSVASGANFHLRLEDSTDQASTCRLVGPAGHDASKVEVESNNEANCGFIVKNVIASDSGVWQIVYGDRITYTATVAVNVEETTVTASQVLSLVRNQPAEAILGDATAVYCKLEDPSGFVAFEGFGQCQLNLTRVSSDHAGTWTMHVGLPGRVITDTVYLNVAVTEAEAKPTVAVSVEKVGHVVYMTCSVTLPSAPKACKFRKPAGDILLANEGVGEDRFSFYGAGSSVVSEGFHHECGLRITEPVVSDLGMWRCAVETNDDVYYGFLTVLCPWAMMDPAIAASVVQEPTIFADKPSVTALEGDDAILSCNIAAPIRYCYFRSQNGSVFPVGPETSSHNYGYSGAGFDSGECGIRFSALAPRDAGRWSCHVGLEGDDEEQKADITLTVYEKLAVVQTDNIDGSLTVEGRVYGHQALEYCRFVRMDGFGFTSASITVSHHQSITDLSSLAHGICSIRVANANILDHHPWTIAARISGHGDEVFGTTDHTITMPSAEPEPDQDHDHGHGNGQETIIYYYRNHTPIFLIVLVFALAAASLVLLFAPKKNRQWTYNRASNFRDSFRRSFRMNNDNQEIQKKPIDPVIVA